jgi:hypothetical protein
MGKLAEFLCVAVGLRKIFRRSHLDGGRPPEIGFGLEQKARIGRLCGWQPLPVHWRVLRRTGQVRFKIHAWTSEAA